MKKSLKKLLITLLIFPVIILCSCGKDIFTCKTVSAQFYFKEEITCDIYRETSQQKLNISSIIGDKVDLNTLSAYAKLTFSGNSAELFHLYIEYISFKVYTNESSDYSLDININLTNVIKEEDVGKDGVEDNTFSNTYSCQAKANGSVQVNAKIDRVVATATGSTLTIDALTSDMFVSSDSTFKWTIYDFKIYAESRAYSK